MSSFFNIALATFCNFNTFCGKQIKSKSCRQMLIYIFDEKINVTQPDNGI